MEISQTAVGDALGVTFQQIQKYERGFNRVSSSRLHELSVILGVDVSYFFDGGPGKRVLKSGGPDTDHIAEFTASSGGKRLMQGVCADRGSRTAAAHRPTCHDASGLGG